MAKKKRQVSAQTRVKLSQAAKRRQRGTKGTSMGGKFLSGAAPSFGSKRPVISPSMAKNPFFHVDKGTGTTGTPKQPAGEPHRGPRGGNPSELREFGQSVYADNARRAQRDPDAVAKELTRLTLERHTNPTSDPNARGVRTEDFVGPSPNISRARKQADAAHKSKHWKNEGVYATSERKTPARFVKEDMDPDHRAEFDKLRDDPNSPFNRTAEGLPGDPKSGRANRRRELYTTKLQEGWSHDDAISHVQNLDERRGRKPGSGGAGSKTVRDRQAKRQGKGATRGSKFENVNDQYRGKKEMEFGVDMQAASSLSELGERYPDMSDRDLLRTQQAERMSIQDEFEKNVAWAHETKRANLMGEDSDSGGRKKKEDDDRVVFFTTNLGSPAPSVPADSLIGQYVIRRRKKMMKELGYSDASLRGEFPRAVRDMHLLELSTGIKLGVEGRAGVYNETGMRRGTKTSKGYNKPTPMGSHMLTDSAGSPMYDAQGNVRYSEGATRPINWQSPSAGLKIFIG